MQVYDNREQQSNRVLFFQVDIVVAREGGENAREHFTSFKKSYVNVQVVGGKNRYVVVCDDIDSASPDVKTVDVLCHT